MSPRKRGRSVPLERQREAVEVLHDLLVQEYGVPEPKRRLPVLDELVLTILSQNTNDTNRDTAWGRLKRRFPDWESVADAPREELEEALQPGGLHRVKARRIQEILAQIAEERGSYDLDHLEEMELDEARRELLSIKGLGAKSVNCILLFSMGRPAFPVDTHVYRVLRRVGVHDCNDLTRANDELQEAVPDEITYAFHVNVIRHGRRVCGARTPECWRCVIEDVCGHDDKNLTPPTPEA